MKRSLSRHRRALIAAGCALVWALHACGDGDPDPKALQPITPKRPNVLLYVIDTLRADALDFSPRSKASPRIAAFAAESTVYERAYAPSSWTRASMASLFTGKLPSRHRTETRDDLLASSLPFLPAILSRAGYDTAGITTNPNIGSFFGFDRGYGELIELYERRAVGKVDSKEAMTKSDVVTARAIEWIDAAERPFFLSVLSVDPHFPYTPPGALIDAAEQALPDSGRGAWVRRHRTRYWAEVAFNDASFGRLIDHLRETGALDDTIVVLTSDHGEEFWEHGRFQHGQSLFQEVLRIPLVVRWPAADPQHGGRRIDAPVGLIDVLPTIVTRVGAELPPVLDGERLARAAAREDRAMLSSLRLEGRDLEAVVRRPWKLVLDRRAGTEALYHLERDPGEKHPLKPPLDPEAQRARDALAKLLQAMPKSALDAARETSEPLPEKVERSLRALGYIE